LHPESSDAREVREGTLVCEFCGSSHTVHRGVGELLVEPPEHVAVEADGLGRFAELMRSDGWDADKIRRLPNIDDGYWYVQAFSINQLANEIDFAPGEWLLDIGSNTCWASNFFATRGLRVVALDISLWEMQGLWSSDFFIAEDISYFERVLGSMSEMPIASDSLDYVYACEVLHHNDVRSLRATFEEAYRVLKPGGRMLVINETLKSYADPVGVHPEAVAEFEGYEHAHWAARYRWEAIHAGFSTRLIMPRYHGFWSAPKPEGRTPLRPLRRFAWEMLRRDPVIGHRLYTSWLNHLRGGVSFGMVATKPARDGSLLGLAQRAGLRDPRRRAVPFG
jgi:SAM-dependent methyltransferase